MNKCIHWEEIPFNSCSVNGRDFYCVKCLWKLAENKETTQIYISDVLEKENTIEWTELDQLSFPKKLIYNNFDNIEIKKQKIEKLELELDIPSILESMIEKSIKGNIYWIKCIKY